MVPQPRDVVAEGATRNAHLTSYLGNGILLQPFTKLARWARQRGKDRGRVERHVHGDLRRLDRWQNTVGGPDPGPALGNQSGRVTFDQGSNEHIPGGDLRIELGQAAE